MPSIPRTVALLAALAALAAPAARAGDIRMRAREHYETLSVQDGDRSFRYAGFTNTLNLWYEEPYRWSAGLAGSPLLATLRTKRPPDGGSSDIRLVHLGVEGKLFPAPAALPLFVRLGLYDASLSSFSAAGPLSGWSALVGLGYEFDLGGIGLAPEIAGRRAWLPHGVGAVGSAPAIGLHFYKTLSSAPPASAAPLAPSR